MTTHKLSTTFFLCGIILSVAGLLGGCSNNSTNTELEKEFRAPKGPPSPEVQKALDATKAAEDKDRANGR